VTSDQLSTPKPKTSSFGLDVAKLAGSTSFGQLLTIVAMPVLSRIYSPDSFGVAEVFAALVTVIGTIACLRYDLALMLPERDEDAANLLATSFFFTIITTFLTTLAVFVGREALAEVLNTPELASYLWLAPLGVLGTGGFLALNSWNSRKRRYGRLSVAGVTRSTTTVGTQLGAGLGYPGTAGGLIAGKVAGMLASSAMLGVQTWRSESRMIFQSVNRQGMLTQMKRYRKFPLFSTWTALLNNISWQLPSFLLASFFSSSVVGYYALGTRLLRAPMSLVGTAIAQVFFQRATEAKAEGTLATLVESGFRALTTLGMFPILLLAITGQDIFVVAFGPSWAEAGVYTQILSVWTFFWFISSPLGTLYSVLERQEVGLVLNVIILATRLISLIVGGVLNDARLALWLFGGSGIVVYGYISLMIANASGVGLKTLFGMLTRQLIVFVPCGGILVLIKKLGASPLHVVILTGILLAGYFVFLLKTDAQMKTLARQVGIPLR
jgi:O-antigen/teichoic acid export membrane protein